MRLDYQVVSSDGCRMTSSRFAQIVQEWIEKGWKPQGGVSVTVNQSGQRVYAQALVRETLEEGEASA